MFGNGPNGPLILDRGTGCYTIEANGVIVGHLLPPASGTSLADWTARRRSTELGLNLR